MEAFHVYQMGFDLTQSGITTFHVCNVLGHDADDAENQLYERFPKADNLKLTSCEHLCRVDVVNV